MSSPSRRQFLKSSAAATTAALAVPAVARAKASANDRIRVGLVGLGGRMTSHARASGSNDRRERRGRRDLRL